MCGRLPRLSSTVKVRKKLISVALQAFEAYVYAGIADIDGSPDLLTGFLANIKKLAKFQAGLGSSGQQFYDSLMDMLDKLGERLDTHAAKEEARTQTV